MHRFKIICCSTARLRQDLSMEATVCGGCSIILDHPVLFFFFILNHTFLILFHPGTLSHQPSGTWPRGCPMIEMFMLRWKYSGNLFSGFWGNLRKILREKQCWAQLNANGSSSRQKSPDRKNLADLSKTPKQDKNPQSGKIQSIKVKSAGRGNSRQPSVGPVA